jgi:hypothetical protein
VTMWSDEQLAHVLDIANKASQPDWRIGHTGTETHEAALAWLTDCLMKSDMTDVWMAFYGDLDNAQVVAFTGNGPTSEANAEYLALCTPHNIKGLVEDLRQERHTNNALRESNDRLREKLGQ